MTLPRTKAKRAVPAALQKRARELHATAQSRLADNARQAIALIREKKSDIAGNLLDIGRALTTLQGDGVAQALGRAGFDELCRLDLDMAPTSARKLIAIAQHFRRETVLALGTDRAHALIELADATPEDDTPEELIAATVTLPSGATLDVASATAAELHDAAREIRQAHKPSRRGLTASADERKRYSERHQRLKAAGCEGATMRLVASRDEAGAWVELRVRLSDLDAASRALATKRAKKPARKTAKKAVK